MMTRSTASPRRTTWFTSWTNLSYPQKFTVITLIFALSLLAFSPLIFDQNTRISNYGKKELEGNSFLRLLWQLSTDIQSLHIATVELQNGTSTEANLNTTQIKVEEDIRTIEIASEQYKPILGNDFNLQDLKNRWALLKNALRDKRFTDAEDGFTNLSNSINSIITNAGNSSYLILDPDLDTYYLMDTVLLRMPENKALALKIWEIANEASTNKELPSDKQFELNSLVSQLKSNLNILDQNLQTAYSNNKNRTIEPVVAESAQKYLAANQFFINLITTYMANSQTNQLSSVVLKASYTGVRDTNETLYTAASNALDSGIQNRIQLLSFNLYFAIMLSALSTLFAYLVGSRIMRTISQPLLQLLEATQRLTAGDISTRVTSTGNDEAAQVTRAFNVLAEEVENNRATLQARANELEKRTQELETIAEVSRDIAIIHDLNTMLNVASSLIYERFSFYHVAIFLVDERNEYAILRSASGSSSQQLLEQGYKVRIGSPTIVGSVAQTGQAQISDFTDKNPSGIYFEKNKELLQTNSEIGLPLHGKSLVIGVLDIHSNFEKAFSKREIQVFQILADQLSAAIENAQLVEQVEGTISQLNKTIQTQTQRNWSGTSSVRSLAYEYDGFHIQPIPKHLPKELISQLENGKTIVVKNERSEETIAQNTLIVPLVLSGQVIGVVGLEKENVNDNWNAEEIAIAQAAANHAAITLENARLLEESQRRASKEQTISEATSKISRSLNVENILNTTIEELERILGSSEVTLQFNHDEKSSLNQQGK